MTSSFLVFDLSTIAEPINPNIQPIPTYDAPIMAVSVYICGGGEINKSY